MKGLAVLARVVRTMVKVKDLCALPQMRLHVIISLIGAVHRRDDREI